MIRFIKLVYANFRINYIRHKWHFSQWKRLKYVSVPEFQIHSNPTIPILDVRNRRYDMIERAQHSSLDETNMLLDQIQKALINYKPEEPNTMTKFEFMSSCWN